MGHQCFERCEHGANTFTIATCADEYLAGYLGENGAIPPVSIDRILKAAQRIESML